MCQLEILVVPLLHFHFLVCLRSGAFRIFVITGAPAACSLRENPRFAPFAALSRWLRHHRMHRNRFVCDSMGNATQALGGMSARGFATPREFSIEIHSLSSS
jgi:hypothetical protein